MWRSLDLLKLRPIKRVTWAAFWAFFDKNLWESNQNIENFVNFDRRWGRIKIFRWYLDDIYLFDAPALKVE